MKNLMSLMLGLSLLAGTGSLFAAQDKPAETTKTTKTKKAHKAKKPKATDKTAEKKS